MTSISIAEYRAFLGDNIYINVDDVTDRWMDDGKIS